MAGPAESKQSERGTALTHSRRWGTLSSHLASEVQSAHLWHQHATVCDRILTVVIPRKTTSVLFYTTPWENRWDEASLQREPACSPSPGDQLLLIVNAAETSLGSPRDEILSCLINSAPAAAAVLLDSNEEDQRQQPIRSPLFRSIIKSLVTSRVTLWYNFVLCFTRTKWWPLTGRIIYC